MISILTLAIDKKISLYSLRSIMIPYPTRSDLIKRLSDTIVITTLRNLRAEIVTYIKKRVPILIGLTIWLSIIGVFIAYKNTTGKDNLALIKDLYYMITQTYYGPLLYIVFYAIRPVIFFPATLLTFLSGLLFGIG